MSENGSTDNFADDEGSSYTSEYTEDTTYSDIADNVHAMVGILNVLHDQMESMTTQLKTLEDPVTHVMIEQFGNIQCLESSPFRTSTFRLAKPFPGLAPDARYPYKDIVAFVRNYIFNEKLVNADGTIRTNRILRTMFELEDDETTFPTLLRNLRKVLV
jgi:hypothetical protein